MILPGVDVVGAGVGQAAVEQGFDCGVDLGEDLHSALWVELTAEADHPGLSVGPRPEPGIATLLLQPFAALAGIQPGDLDGHSLVELLWRRT